MLTYEPAVEDLGNDAPRRRAGSSPTASTPAKNAALLTAADLLLERAAEIQAANDADLDAAGAAGMDARPLDRLRLTDARLEAMANGLRTVAALPDPVGEVLDGWTPARTGSRSRGCACRSASSRSSTRTGPTSRATPPGSA